MIIKCYPADKDFERDMWHFTIGLMVITGIIGILFIIALTLATVARSA